jgi:hypothetical protein
VDLWIPGAEVVGGAHQAGLPMNGDTGCRKAVWHITWDNLDPRPTLDGVSAYLLRMGYEPHILYDPQTGRFLQYMPADRGSYALKANNKQGSLCVQIEVFFSPGLNGWMEAFTDAPCANIDVLMKWLDQLGIPRVTPLEFTHPYKNVDVNTWNNVSGHYGHLHAPSPDTHTDPQYPPNFTYIFAAGTTPQPQPPAQEDEVAQDMNWNSDFSQFWEVARGGDDRIWVRRWIEKLSKWDPDWAPIPTPHKATGAPSISFGPDDRVDIAARGGDMALWRCVYIPGSDTWSQWFSDGGGIK